MTSDPQYKSLQVLDVDNFVEVKNNWKVKGAGFVWHICVNAARLEQNIQLWLRPYNVYF